MKDHPERVDVAVVGGGVIGVSVAYHLSKSGVRVILFERQEIGGGASFANPGTVSLATKRPGLHLEMAKRSLDRFPRLADELGQDFEFEQCGTLLVAEDSDQMQFLVALAEAQRAVGTDVDTIDGERAHQLCTALGPTVIGASYRPTDAQVNPFKLTYAFAAAAERNGAVIVRNEPVTEIKVTGERVTEVGTRERTIRTQWVVNAAGAHADEIAALVGVRHGITPRRGQMLVLEPQTSLPSMWVASARGLMARHRARGGQPYSFSYCPKPRSRSALVGVTNEDVGFARHTTVDALSAVATEAVRLMPALRDAHVIRTWSGLRPYCADGPLIGQHGGPNGYIVAGGHGGDGIATSPVTGEAVARLIIDGEAPDWIGA